MDSQFSVTAVLFHGDHKIASAGTGDGYVQHVYVCTRCLIKTLQWVFENLASPIDIVGMDKLSTKFIILSVIPCTL